jgi:uncharacterized protein YndB with AHSA1/START domain
MIHKTYKIKATLEKVWNALVDPKIIEQWGGGPNVKMSEIVGEEFSLWDGDIFGKNIEVHPQKILKQQWYGGKWKTPSIVNFQLSYNGEATTVDLTHSEIPKESQDSEEDFSNGWDTYYMGPLKELVEDQ